MKKRILVPVIGLSLCLFSMTAFGAGYEPGTYEASAQGLGGLVTVTMTMDGTSITDIMIEGQDETPEIGGAAIEALQAAILEAQSADVEAVTGATITSTAVLDAVKDCIAQAAGGEEAAPSEETAEEPGTEKTYPNKEASLPDWYKSSEKNAQAAIDYAPRVTTMDNGVQVQPTPYDDRGWNNTFMDADMRGCNSCHVLEDIVTQMESYHGVVYYKYNSTQTLATCLMCHSFYDTPLRDTIHATHMGNTAFQSMGGSCNSCHYITMDGKYERWDYVKYDHLKGITDIAAEDAQIEVTYDQEVLTPRDQMFYKSPKVVINEPSDWLTDDSQIVPEIYDQWTITVSGDVDNPFTMTLPEMVETFELNSQVQSSQCCINGTGQALIYQAEITGIYLKDIFEYAGVHDDVTTFNVNCIDSYGTGHNQYPLNWDFVLENDGMLVLEMNGEPIPADQGYPAAVWVANSSAGNAEKFVTELIVTREEDPQHWPLPGYFVDPSTGETFSKPNMGVLSTWNGTIFPAGETIHLEGFADAWDEPIEYMEYSLDHGATWIKIDTPNNDRRKWTYWYLDFTPPTDARGAYLIRMRATSRQEDGELRTAKVDTDFLINVQ